MDNKMVVLYIALVIMWAIVMGAFITLPEARTCTMKDIYGNVLEGNCTHLISVMEEKALKPPDMDDYEDVLLDDSPKIVESYGFDDGEGAVDFAEVCKEFLQAKPMIYMDTWGVKANDSILVYRDCPDFHCPDCAACVCDICTTCEVCDYMNKVQVHTALNARPNTGMGVYQSGWYDAKKYYLELFKVEGRPKFSGRPPSGAADMLYTLHDEITYFKFRDEGDKFYLNKTYWNIANKSNRYIIYHLRWENTSI